MRSIVFFGLILLAASAMTGCVNVVSVSPKTHGCAIAAPEAAGAQQQAVEFYRQLHQLLVGRYSAGQLPSADLLEPLFNYQAARIRHWQMTTPGVDWREVSVTELWLWSAVCRAPIAELEAAYQAAGGTFEDVLEAKAEAAQAEAVYQAQLYRVNKPVAFEALAAQNTTLNPMDAEAVTKVIDAMLAAEYGKTVSSAD